MAACVTLMGMQVLAAACSSAIYVRGGLADGDTFYLPPSIYLQVDPVVQSWITYSLGESACKLDMGGDNPGRNTSFECELRARKLLVQSWLQQWPGPSPVADAYLDNLTRIEQAGFLREYVWQNYRHRSWQSPGDLRLGQYRAWRKSNIRGHRPRTRRIGWWGYQQEPGEL